MQILEYGKKTNNKIILIHGFQMPLDSLNEYINILKKDYFVIVPILPGHNPNDKEEFETFSKCLSEFEDYYITNNGKDVYAIIAFSMGGVFASYIWQNRKLEIKKIIMESSPLLKWNKIMINMMTKQYISMTDKTRKRNKKIVNQAINSIVREENLDSFLVMMDNMRDQTIRNYLHEVGVYNLPNDIYTPNTEIYYSYGGKVNEFIFKKVGKYINRNYSNSRINCIKGKRHCEDVIFNPEEKIKEFIRILNK